MQFMRMYAPVCQREVATCLYMLARGSVVRTTLAGCDVLKQLTVYSNSVD